MNKAEEFIENSVYLCESSVTLCVTNPTICYCTSYIEFKKANKESSTILEIP